MMYGPSFDPSKPAGGKQFFQHRWNDKQNEKNAEHLITCHNGKVGMRFPRQNSHLIHAPGAKAMNAVKYGTPCRAVKTNAEAMENKMSARPVTTAASTALPFSAMRAGFSIKPR